MFEEIKCTCKEEAFVRAGEQVTKLLEEGQVYIHTNLDLVYILGEKKLRGVYIMTDRGIEYYYHLE